MSSNGAEAGHAHAALRILTHLLRDFPGATTLRLLSEQLQHIEIVTPKFTLLLRDPVVLRKLIFGRSPLPLADAYINGLIDVEGDLYAALGLKQYFQTFDFSLGVRWALLRDAWRLPAKPRNIVTTPFDSGGFSHRHSKGSDQAAIAFHYDVSNLFYKLWLDKEMVYSCAYFESEHDTLERAQEHKLDHICRKLRLKPGERLLDIGCGWGAMVCWAARHYGVRAHGITLSHKQFEYAQARIAADGLKDLVTVELRDYRDLEGEAVYDKISSIGMFEHVGLSNLPTYNAIIKRVLRPGGLFLNHGITHDEEGWQRTIDTEFINRYVFPDGELDTVSNIQRRMEQTGFEIHDVEALRPHYALTLRHWVQRLEEHREEALEYVSESAYRVWRLYMAACALEFESGGTGIYQILASKPGGAKPAVPLTRSDIYTTG
ncbi:class I SAM-dependent methyltransferase [Herminiimonas aquatilis]|uniref:Class I SAM-dependent methyltransferase n=1 Tax=Herminiimonas aquatilis TaxID=345342 RepID=A0ABW2J0V2_9BURK